MTSFPTEDDVFETRILHHFYNSFTSDEHNLMMYKVDTNSSDPLGFYTREDFDSNVVVEALNADLKHWLFFYGAPEPGSLEWWTAVVHHRDRSIVDNLAAFYDRITIECVDLIYTNTHTEEALP